MAEAILTGEKVEKLSPPESSRSQALILAVIAGFPEYFLVSDGPCDAGNRDRQNQEPQQLCGERIQISVPNPFKYLRGLFVAALFLRGHFCSQADVLHCARFRRVGTFRSDWPNTLCKPIVVELLTLRPPDGVSRRALHIRKRLKCSYRRNRYIAV